MIKNVILFVFCLQSGISVTMYGPGDIEGQYTVKVDPGRDDCYYQEANKGDEMTIAYQVLDGGHGDLDITFHFVDPNGRILGADFKKSENSWRKDIELDGFYKFCFDNTFSSFNSKEVFFEFAVRKPTAPEAAYEYASEIPIESSIKPNLRIVEQRADQVMVALVASRTNEIRDQYEIDRLAFFVSAFSLLQLIVMLFVGLVQVFMIRSLFDESSRAHFIWKKIDR